MSVAERRRHLRRVTDGQLRNDAVAGSLQQVCHDLRQEVAVLISLVEVAMDERDAAGDGQGGLELVLEQAVRLTEMLTGFVASTAQPVPIDISEIMREVVNAARAMSPSPIAADIEDGAVVVADPQVTRRAFLNMLDNAVRAAGPAGQVAVRMHRADGLLLVEVEDSGPGFGAAARGLASVGMSVVQRWTDDVGGFLEVGRGRFGGALVQMVVGDYDAATILSLGRSR